MSNIEDAKETAAGFLQKALGVGEVRVIGVTNVDDGWEVDAEIYEENTFLKSIGLPTKVQDRNIYIVKLDDKLEIKSYERQHQVMSTS